MKGVLIGAASRALACICLLTAGCGGINVDVWPFGGARDREVSRAPADAIEYQCDGGKRLYVRYLDNGAAAWVILPERQFRLDKAIAASGARYGNGRTTLDTRDKEATLSEGPAITYAGCKTAAP